LTLHGFGLSGRRELWPISSLILSLTLYLSPSKAEGISNRKEC
jgi:hypothetical protein